MIGQTDKDEQPTLSKIYPGMITLQLPQKTKKYSTSFDSAYQLNHLRKEELLELLKPLFKLIAEEKVTLSPLSANEIKAKVPLMRSAGMMQKFLKDELATIYSAFERSISNIPAIAEVDKRYKEVWKRLLTNFEVEDMEVGDIFGREIKFFSTYGWGSSYVPEAIFFPIEIYGYVSGKYYYDQEVEYTFGVQQKYRPLLTEYFLGEDILKPQYCMHLPDDEDLKIENFEQWIPADLVTLSGMSLNGSMLSANGSIVGAGVKKLKKQADIKEFTPVLDEWPLDRVELIALTYFTELHEKELKEHSELAAKLRKSKGKNKNIEEERSVKEPASISVKEFARFAVNNMPKLIASTRFNSFLPALQGFTKAWSATSYASVLTEMVATMLKDGNIAWQSLYNLRERVLCSPRPKYEYVLKLFSTSDRAKSRLLRRSEKDTRNEGDNIRNIDWFQEVGFRFILNWIKYLCAVGIVEIALEKDLHSADEDSLAGMRYMRLTPLGMYAFGLSESYESSSAEVDNGVEFDGDNGIITLPSANSPYTMFLSTVSRKISPVRYAISTESLIKGCHTKVDLENRISSLRTVIDFDTEPALKRIVEDALSRTDCTEREGGYSLLRIRKHIPEITAIITTDKSIRKIAIPVARGMVLVKTANLDKFYSACTAAGYLLE